MNKIAIPAILVATVMVAGMFAFVPVEADVTHDQITTVVTRNNPETLSLSDDVTISVTKSLSESLSVTDAVAATAQIVVISTAADTT